MLKLIDITKEYKVDEESVLALHGIDLEFRRNEFVSILGPSGCGKTTLLNIIGGLDRYTSGDIQVDGVSTKEYDDVDWDTYRNRRIGFVFQSYNLIPHMNILRNVAMSLTLAGIGSDERKRRAYEALRKVGLENQARKKPNQLSGGQMQRVAIARALVNNPDIILADEPTGALDSESGIQVMDLLKEVAEDRLVIMVTHNPTLANEYSTRIVYLKDGELEGDTMPYDSAAEQAEAKANANKTEATSRITGANGEQGVVYDENALNQPSDTSDDGNKAEGGKAYKAAKAPKREHKKSRFEAYRQKVREHDKSSMKIKTAVSLSFNNLLSKKGRTFLTSVAGSIGIIGIIIVLALSTGVTKYVERIGENALSQYPIQINETALDLKSVMNALAGYSTARPEFPNTNNIYAEEIIGNIVQHADELSGQNDLIALKKYLDEHLTHDLGQIKYDYGTTLNIFSNYMTKDENGNYTEYMKISPFTDVLDSFMGDLQDNPIIGPMLSELTQYATMLDSWDEMTTNTELLNQQYDIVAGDWPKQDDPATEEIEGAEEIIVVLDEKNQIPDFAFLMLGLVDPSKAISNVISGKKPILEEPFDANKLIGLDYKVLTNADYLREIEGDPGMYEAKSKKTSDREFVETADSNINIKIVGVVRPKKGAGVTSLNSTIAYTQGLTKLAIRKAQQHPAVLAQKEAYEEGSQASKTYASRITYEYSYYPSAPDKTTQITKGGNAYMDGAQNADGKSFNYWTELRRSLGDADLDHPQSIYIYSKDFASKDKIESILADYPKIMKEQTGRDYKSVKYTDFLSLIMGYVGTLTTTVTGVLVGFSAISLLVSTIMIAIIIYTSVLERRKEIGVLRSLGARKKDISRVFLAESSMLGAYSGVIGLVVSGILMGVCNAILFSIFGIENLVLITWWQCLLMFSISVLLSMLAGFIPSRIAAKKDPAIALRSE